MAESPLRILLIDDDEDSLVITRELLSQIAHGSHTIEWVDTYEAGLDRLLQAQHDVYLLDYRLGARNGMELLREALDAGCRAPIIMLTGQGDHEIDLEAMQAGAMDYLVKDEINAALLERSIRHATERQRLLNALQQAADDLQRSNRELEQFAYIASHDLQAPLRRVKSFCQLLERRCQGKLDADAEEFIGYIVEGAESMQRLIRDLLAFSRVGRQGAPLAPTDCSAVLDCALENLQIAIEESNATITRDSLPTVMADSTQLLQLLQNLIGNAITYRSDQPPHIHVGVQRRPGDWLISVRDNGIGIEPKHTSEIFTIFKRLHSSDKYPGTGIGLAVCKKIVERHGGRIWVESQPGQGSTFYFTVPASA
jgi:light-regulated signal transduction histidine kinase (bacteriophytochrome)